MAALRSYFFFIERNRKQLSPSPVNMGLKYICPDHEITIHMKTIRPVLRMKTLDCVNNVGCILTSQGFAYAQGCVLIHWRVRAFAKRWGVWKRASYLQTP